MTRIDFPKNGKTEEDEKKMAVTKFEKPMGTEVQSLSEQMGNLNSKLTTTSFSVTRNEQNTTRASYTGKKAGNCCVISIDCTTNANSGWVTIGTSSEKPNVGLYGTIVNTSGNSTLLLINSNGTLQIFSPAASNYIGQITFCV